jgi:sugar O-acyltransferase (sialic acid O-acetyltransferase NeuD family)
MQCVVYGVGSPYVFEVVEILRRMRCGVHGFVANREDAEHPPGLGPVATLADLPVEWRTLPVVIPMITPAYRKQAEAEARERGFTTFLSIVDPTAVVAASAELGEGAVANAACLVGARARLGRFVSLNRGASVGHDVIAGDYVTFGPGCIVCGSCRLGDGVFVGAGAVLNPKTQVGANAVIGAGAVVIADVMAHTLVVGNPARVKREGVAGYNDAGV